MRVSTKLQTISLFMIAVLVVLLVAAFTLFNETKSASNNLKLGDEILSNIQERTSISDQYFLYHEEHMLIRWDESKQKSDQLLRLAKLQFQGREHQQIIDSLIKNIDETAIIFHRIAANSNVMKSAAGNREILEELNKRLLSQLLLIATTIRERILTLKDLTTHGVKRSYQNMIVVVFVLTGMMAFFTLLFSASMMRLMRLRLIPLHEGTRSIGNGDLECRIKISGSDEFTELAHAVNTMTDKLSVEIETRIKAEEELQLSRAAELEQKRSEEVIRSLFEWTPVATIIHHDDKIIYTNPKAITLFGGESQQDLLDKSFRNLIHKDFQQESLARKALVDQGVAVPMMECKFLKLDGTVIDAEIQSTVFDFVGAKMHIPCLTDISERKKAEEERQTLEQQFQQTQKLESLGVLSGGIAHDFNNILAIIVGNCGLAKMDSENAEDYIPEIEKAAERAAALCRQMLAYAGKAQLTKTQVNMPLLVDEMVNMLKKTLPQNAVIKLDLATDIPSINADASQIRQVVMNLIINAAEAIGKVHGEINVSLARTTFTIGASDQDYNGKLIPPGKYICLEVTDNGCGMDEQTKWRIFEPFYTTKFAGRGLGMSAVLGIINSHNGELQLFSQLGHGSTFKVYLPVSANDFSGDEYQCLPIPPAPWQGSGTVLLVEDEDQIRMIAKALLNKFGFTVLEATNGKEALELYQKNAADILLVLTDMGMPVLDGYELFYALKNLSPKLPIIISSGFGDMEVSSRIGSDNIAGLISKPYNPDQLREVLKGIIEGTY